MKVIELGTVERSIGKRERVITPIQLKVENLFMLQVGIRKINAIQERIFEGCARKSSMFHLRSRLFFIRQLIVVWINFSKNRFRKSTSVELQTTEIVPAQIAGIKRLIAPIGRKWAFTIRARLASHHVAVGS